MAKIAGNLLADLFPDGTVRMVFIGTFGGGNEAPITAKNLDAAEIEFVRTCGLAPGPLPRDPESSSERTSTR